MYLGERSRFTCSPEWCYGDSGFCAWGIAPNSYVMWELEVLQIGEDEDSDELDSDLDI